MLTPKHIAIIGAGPAGLMAAEVIATAGLRVTVYDRMPSPGRKLLMAGRGGLNLTHSEPLERLLTRYGAANDWLAPALQNFTPTDLRAWCEGLGQETFTGSSGRVFPRAMKAAPLLRAWMRRLEALGVHFVGRYDWTGWEEGALRFKDAAGGKVLVATDATLLAMGGASWPRLGANGQWMDILADAQVSLAPLRPANCGFTVAWSPYLTEHFAGAPLKPVSLTHEGITIQGEAMITAQGLEGGAVYALSASLRDAIAQGGSTVLTLDLRPALPLDALTKKLQAPRASQSLSTHLRRAGFSPLAIALLREVTPGKQLAHASAFELAQRLKSLPVTLTSSFGIARAISTAGGVMRQAVTEDFMLHAKPGVFVAGEMLDWEAPTGGYLLQGCFSTAVVAAKGILRYCAS